MITQEKLKKIRALQALSFIFIFVAYLPFYIALFCKFDVMNYTICWIGYRFGYFAFLLTFGLMTGAFLIYHIYFFAKITESKDKLLRILPVIAALFFIATVFTPIRETDPIFIHRLHNAFGGASAGVSVIAVSYSVLLYCLKHKADAKKVAPIYIMFCICAAVCFCLIGNKAVLQVGMSLGFFIFLFFFNSAAVKKLQVPHNRTYAGAVQTELVPGQVLN